MSHETRKYFKDYFEESDKINDSFTVTDSKGRTHIFDKDMVLAEILAMPKSVQETVRKKFVIIDFQNGDINHFINYMLKGLVQ